MKNVLLILALMVLLALPAMAEKAATLESFSGPVEVRATASGAWTAATAGMDLDRAATVRAGVNATAKIVAVNGRTFQLRPNSQFAVQLLLVTVPANERVAQLRQQMANQPQRSTAVVGAMGVRGEGIDEARVNRYLVWEESVSEEDKQVQQLYNTGISLLKGGMVDEALAQFQAIVADHATSSVVDDAAYMVANIFERDLKAPDVAREQYARFVETYPRSQFRHAAERAVQRLAAAVPVSSPEATTEQ